MKSYKIILVCVLIFFSSIRIFASPVELFKIKDIAVIDSLIRAVGDSTDIQSFRLGVRKAELQFSMSDYLQSAQTARRYLVLFDKKYHRKTDEWVRVHTDLLFWYGYSLAHMGYYSNAIEQFHNIIELYGEDINSYPYAKACRGLGALYGLKSDPGNACKYFNELLRVSRMLNDYEGMSGSLSNLGVLQLQNMHPDSALVYLMEANKIAIMHKDECELERILYLIGAAYCYSGKDDLGMKYLQEAMNVAVANNSQSLALFIENFIIHYRMGKGETSELRGMCQEHLRKARAAKAKNIEADALLMLARINRMENQNEQAYLYLDSSYVLSDSLMREGNHEHFQVIKDMLVSEDNVRGQEAVDEYRMKSTRKTVAIVILSAVVVALMAFCLVLWRRKIVTCDMSDSDDTRLATDMADNEQLLGLFSQSRNNETINSVLGKLQELKQSFNTAGKSSQLIRDIEDELSSLEEKQDWQAYQHLFEQEHAALFVRLAQYCPSLTSGDKRLCMFICLNMSTKEIASVTSRSVRSVETAKFRLKKKMGLSPEESLHAFINHMKNDVEGGNAG